MMNLRRNRRPMEIEVAERDCDSCGASASRSWAARSAAVNSATLLKRSEGVRASALRTASSRAAGTVSRTTLRRGAGSADLRAKMTRALEPIKGGSPASILINDASKRVNVGAGIERSSCLQTAPDSCSWAIPAPRPYVLCGEPQCCQLRARFQSQRRARARLRAGYSPALHHDEQCLASARIGALLRSPARGESPRRWVAVVLCRAWCAESHR